MASLLIRDLPNQTRRALKRQASLNKRPLQKEVHRILADATRDDVADPLPALALRISDADVRGPIDREEIYRASGR